MERRDPRPSEHQESSQNHEEDKREMDYQDEIGERSVNQVVSAEDSSLPDSGGPAEASNVILFTSSSKRGSLRSESTNGCTRRYAAHPRRSSIARSTQSRAFCLSPMAMCTTARSTGDT